MRLHRFYYHSIPQDGRFTVSDKRLLHQWRNVFRFRAGDTVVLFPGEGHEFVSTFAEIDKTHAILSVGETRDALVQMTPITLFPALIKKDNLEWIFQKGTELGVRRFVPMRTERSEKKGFNDERAQKIIIEAAEQSGWGVIPELERMQTLKDIVATEKSLVAFDAGGVPFARTAPEDGAGLLIGPEGGFSPTELELFRANNIPISSLGPSTLRAETAAIVAAAMALL